MLNLKMKPGAFVKWPDAPLTDSLVRSALSQLHLRESLDFLAKPACYPDGLLLQWSTYDAIDHELTLLKPKVVLSSSYTIRKALIRKHFLHRCLLSYTTKYADSILTSSVPRTWELEISFADELDDMWADQLYHLSEELDNNTSGKWWILKPGMADRGMGIRLFNSKKSLQAIFEKFDENSDDEDDYTDEATNGGTNVVISQLRHFVIQEYLQDPVLMDPSQVIVDTSTPSHRPSQWKGYKFHLRVYCLASGNLSVYLYDRILALFSSVPFESPSEKSSSPEDLDLRPHLTNTCLQQDRSEQNVRLLQELIGCTILSGGTGAASLCAEDVDDILLQISDVLADIFRAAVQSPVHFQPLPNAFELFGVDFLVTHRPLGRSAEKLTTNHQNGRFQINILEVNSEPAIEMTGSRLKWILEDLFNCIANTVVEPFFNSITVPRVQTRSNSTHARHLRKCLEINSGW